MITGESWARLFLTYFFESGNPPEGLEINLGKPPMGTMGTFAQKKMLLKLLCRNTLVWSFCFFPAIMVSSSSDSIDICGFFPEHVSLNQGRGETQAGWVLPPVLWCRCCRGDFGSVALPGGIVSFTRQQWTHQPINQPSNRPSNQAIMHIIVFMIDMPFREPECFMGPKQSSTNLNAAVLEWSSPFANKPC